MFQKPGTSVFEDLLIVTEAGVLPTKVAPSVRGSEIVEIVPAPISDRNDGIDCGGFVVKGESITIDWKLTNLACPSSAFKDVVPVLPVFARDLAGAIAGPSRTLLRFFSPGSRALEALAFGRTPGAVYLRAAASLMCFRECQLVLFRFRA